MGPTSLFFLLLILLLTTAHAMTNITTPAFLDLCPLLINSTIIPTTNITWSQTLTQPIHSFAGSSYLRPDIGGALLPWVYSILILIVHIPVVVIRVVRWQTVQNWCLAGTLLNVVIIAQGYASTGFDSQMVLTWTPLLLVIDAGSMAQVLFLVNEEFALVRRLLGLVTPGGVSVPARGSRDENPTAPDAETFLMIEGEQKTAATTTTTTRCASPAAQTSTALPPLFTSKPLYTFLAAAILLIIILTLQLLGLAHASASSHLAPPLVSWCSPIFQPFGLAVISGSNCALYPIAQTFAKGVGCITIPGVQQAAWLSATVAGTGLSIGLEILDIIVLACVGSSARWRGVKMRRPWFTMIAGVVALGLVLVFGLVYASALPPGVGERVWVVTQFGQEAVVFEGELGTAGLRGAMIGWNDGVFRGWGVSYFGTWEG